MARPILVNPRKGVFSILSIRFCIDNGLNNAFTFRYILELAISFLNCLELAISFLNCLELVISFRYFVELAISFRNPCYLNIFLNIDPMRSYQNVLSQKKLYPMFFLRVHLSQN